MDRRPHLPRTLTPRPPIFVMALALALASQGGCQTDAGAGPDLIPTIGDKPKSRVVEPEDFVERDEPASQTDAASSSASSSASDAQTPPRAAAGRTSETEPSSTGSGRSTSELGPSASADSGSGSAARAPEPAGASSSAPDGRAAEGEVSTGGPVERSGAGGVGVGSPASSAGADRGVARPAWASDSDSQGSGEGVVGVDERFVVDAMVGQVNGRALYASEVLDPIAGRLRALGQSLSQPMFKRRARELIQAQLGQIIADELIVGEAQRDLGENERRQLRFLLNERRGELLRQYGQGSPELADRTLREKTGKGLEETLEEFRQQMIVQRYMRQKLWPKINVARRDVEREFRERSVQFNPNPTYVIHLISATESEAVEQIDRRLSEGEPFLELAEHPGNRSGVREEGMTVQKLGVAALNEALEGLGAGEYAGPIEAKDRMWWVYVQEKRSPDRRPLREVFNDLERELRQSRFRQLTIEYRRELFERGSYNDMDQMLSALLEVAESRFAAGS